MRIEFDSLQELIEFIRFVNFDKDQLVKGATDTLSKSSDALKQAIKNEEKK